MRSLCALCVLEPVVNFNLRFSPFLPIDLTCETSVRRLPVLRVYKMWKHVAAVVSLLAAGRVTLAQRSGNESICDYYATQRYGGNNSTTQLLLVQSIVTLAYAGSAGLPNPPDDSSGIFNKGRFDGMDVYLRPWFDGSSKSFPSNRILGLTMDFSGLTTTIINRSDNESKQSAGWHQLVRRGSYWSTEVVLERFDEFCQHK